MTEQRRDLAEWDYLVYFFTDDNSPLWDQPWFDNRNKTFAVSAVVAVLSILYITLLCIFLPGSPIETEIAQTSTTTQPPPTTTQLITFALTTTRYASDPARHKRDVANDRLVIEGVINQIQNDSVGFAFEVNDEKGDSIIHRYANAADAIAAMDSLLQNHVTNKNPNQTRAVSFYEEALRTDTAIKQHSFVFFAAQPSDYDSSNKEYFVNDTKSCVEGIAAMDKQYNTHSMVVGTADVTNTAELSGICAIASSDEKIVSIITNFTYLAPGECLTKPVTTTPTQTTATTPTTTTTPETTTTTTTAETTTTPEITP